MPKLNTTIGNTVLKSFDYFKQVAEIGCLLDSYIQPIKVLSGVNHFNVLIFTAVFLGPQNDDQVAPKMQVAECS